MRAFLLRFLVAVLALAAPAAPAALAGDVVLIPNRVIYPGETVTLSALREVTLQIEDYQKRVKRRDDSFDTNSDAIQRLNQTGADEVARRTLTGTYHNLLRKWSDT